MLACDPLISEHRLIERMIAIFAKALGRIEASNRVDPYFVDAAFDFICMYADRTHHGKEEEIYFKALENKKMAMEDRHLMDELIHEHSLGRKLTAALVEANGRYRRGDQTALPIIAQSLRTLVVFYPKHVEKEDQIFFPAARKYFTETEHGELLERYREFDSRLIHEKYLLTVEHFEHEMK